MSGIEHLDDVLQFFFLLISGAMLQWCNGFQFLKTKNLFINTVAPQQGLRLNLDGSNIPLTFALLVFSKLCKGAYYIFYTPVLELPFSSSESLSSIMRSTFCTSFALDCLRSFKSFCFYVSRSTVFMPLRQSSSPKILCSSDRVWKITPQLMCLSIKGYSAMQFTLTVT